LDEFFHLDNAVIGAHLDTPLATSKDESLADDLGNSNKDHSNILDRSPNRLDMLLTGGKHAMT